jgi:hypothetical protein
MTPTLLPLVLDRSGKKFGYSTIDKKPIVVFFTVNRIDTITKVSFNLSKATANSTI